MKQRKKTTAAKRRRPSPTPMPSKGAPYSVQEKQEKHCWVPGPKDVIVQKHWLGPNLKSFSGYSGTSGFKGFSGTSGVTLLEGYSGVSGFAGQEAPRLVGVFWTMQRAVTFAMRTVGFLLGSAGVGFCYLPFARLDWPDWTRLVGSAGGALMMWLWADIYRLSYEEEKYSDGC